MARYLTDRPCYIHGRIYRAHDVVEFVPRTLIDNEGKPYIEPVPHYLSAPPPTPEELAEAAQKLAVDKINADKEAKKEKKPPA